MGACTTENQPSPLLEPGLGPLYSFRLKWVGLHRCRVIFVKVCAVGKYANCGLAARPNLTYTSLTFLANILMFYLTIIRVMIAVT